jgi:glycosyltransferase involved in cell wall biosynthesis
MIPDLSFIKLPQFIEKKNYTYLKKNVGPAIGRADVILTISENAKREIVEYYKTPEEKIKVVYLGSPSGVSKIEDKALIEKVKSKYNILGKYIFFVGTLEPRKNIEGLINAYNLLDKKLKGEYKLVICGGKGWYYDRIFKLVEELQLSDEIIFTGYMNEKEKSCMYSGASLFVFPSFYEGFGMPILEAFVCGIPVITSNNSSLPEVGGDAVVYCEAENIGSISKAITGVLEDGDLQEKLVKKGFEQLKKFSWESSAKTILDVITNK